MGVWVELRPVPIRGQNMAKKKQAQAGESQKRSSRKQPATGGGSVRATRVAAGTPRGSQKTTARRRRPVVKTLAAELAAGPSAVPRSASAQRRVRGEGGQGKPSTQARKKPARATDAKRPAGATRATASKGLSQAGSRKAAKGGSRKRPDAAEARSLTAPSVRKRKQPAKVRIEPLPTPTEISGAPPRSGLPLGTNRDSGSPARFQFVSLAQLPHPRDVSPVGEYALEFELEATETSRGSKPPDRAAREADLPEPFRQLLERCRHKTRDVIGSDQRQAIANTREYPFSSICSLEMRDGNRSGKYAVGTGCLLGPNLVLTAGHNLYHNDVLQGAVQEVRIYPGRNGKDNYINSEVVADRGRLWVPDGWWQYRQRAQDWGLILLQTDLRQQAGSLAAQAWEANRLYNTNFIVLGYPASGTSAYPAFTQVYEIGKIVNVDTQAGTLQHTIDTTQGQSGAPVLAWDSSRTAEGRMVCVGIHNYGQGQTNQASLITSDVISQIKQFIRE